MPKAKNNTQNFLHDSLKFKLRRDFWASCETLKGLRLHRQSSKAKATLRNLVWVQLLDGAALRLQIAPTHGGSGINSGKALRNSDTPSNKQGSNRLVRQQSGVPLDQQSNTSSRGALTAQKKLSSKTKCQKARNNTKNFLCGTLKFKPR